MNCVAATQRYPLSKNTGPWSDVFHKTKVSVVPSGTSFYIWMMYWSVSKLIWLWVVIITKKIKNYYEKLTFYSIVFPNILKYFVTDIFLSLIKLRWCLAYIVAKGDAIFNTFQILIFYTYICIDIYVYNSNIDISFITIEISIFDV